MRKRDRLDEIIEGKNLPDRSATLIIEEAITKIAIWLGDDPSDKESRRHAADLIRKDIGWSYFPTPEQHIENENFTLLAMYEGMMGKWVSGSLRDFAKRIAKFNEKRPKGMQRGAWGTDAKALEAHLRELRRKRKRGKLPPL